MSRPATHTKNPNQHPGLVLLEGMQKWQTLEQKRADNEYAKQKQLEQKAA